MGLIDAIKRWKLAQQGMSSGKKRRKRNERSVVGSMERSTGLRVFLYLLFIIFSSVLVFNNTDRLHFAGAASTSVFLHISLTVGLVLFFDLQHGHKPKNSRVLLVFGSVFFHLLVLRLASVVVTKNSEFSILLMPYALAPMVISVLLGRTCGLFSIVAVTLSGVLLVPEPYMLYYIVISLLSGLTVLYLTKRVRRRGALLRAGLYAGVATLVLAVIFGLIEMPNNAEAWKMLAYKAGSSVGVSVLIAMVVSGMLPVLESAFGLTTDISWLEMSDLNHKLLRRMQLEAPGTFHHSLVVASLAESAAETVGANAAMCRVSAYFHDIGKLKKPEYFIENQGENNPHDSITPTMSALVIIAHVKDGVDLAMKHKLNPLIIDVIREHHGDSLVYYFYHKAKEQRREQSGQVEKGLEKAEDISGVDEKNFRYPGPRPSSKESGIISLADAVESASRTLRKPTPAKIEALIDDIVSKRLNERQLDNSGLSLRELKRIKESFASTLRSMLHSRIDYPKDEDKGDRKSDLGKSKPRQITSAYKTERERKGMTVEDEKKNTVSPKAS